MGRLENRFGADAHPDAALKKEWGRRDPVGVHPRFNGSNEVLGFGVGDNAVEHALIEVRDLKDGVWVSKNSILVPGDQLGPVLEGLLKAEEMEADLAYAPAEFRPTFPITVEEVPGRLGPIKVILDEYNGRIQFKLSHALPGRRTGGGWLSVGVQDIQPIGAMLLKVLKSIPAEAGSDALLTEESPF
jgi:hypothetical protein